METHFKKADKVGRLTRFDFTSSRSCIWRAYSSTSFARPPTKSFSWSSFSRIALRSLALGMATCNHAAIRGTSEGHQKAIRWPSEGHQRAIGGPTEGHHRAAEGHRRAITAPS